MRRIYLMCSQCICAKLFWIQSDFANYTHTKISLDWYIFIILCRQSSPTIIILVNFMRKVSKQRYVFKKTSSMVPSFAFFCSLLTLTHFSSFITRASILYQFSESINSETKKKIKIPCLTRVQHRIIQFSSLLLLMFTNVYINSSITLIVCTTHIVFLSFALCSFSYFDL